MTIALNWFLKVMDYSAITKAGQTLLRLSEGGKRTLGPCQSPQNVFLKLGKQPSTLHVEQFWAFLALCVFVYTHGPENRTLT